MSTYAKVISATLFAGWVIFEATGWFGNPYRTLGFPPPGHADMRHDQRQLIAIGLVEGMSRVQVTARLHELGFVKCYTSDDRHVMSCRRTYREFLNPFEIAWLVEIQFTADAVREITSVSGYGYNDI